MSSAADWLLATKKALGGWDPAKHPRGRDGRFLEVGDLVAIFSGPESPQIDSGTIIAGHYAQDGRFFVAIQSADNGGVKWYRPKQIEQIQPKAVIAPTGPIPDVGGYGDNAKVPWNANFASEAQKVQKNSLAAINDKMAAVVSGKPNNTAALVDSLANSDGGNAIDAGFQTAAEIAKKLGAPSAGGVKQWNKPHLSPSGATATKENSLKSPMKVDGGEWQAAWQIIEDSGGVEEAGFGFAPDGITIEVFDFAKTYAALTAAVSQHGSASPAANALLAKATQAYKDDHPGKPLPGTVFPAAPNTPGFGKVKMDMAEAYVVSEIEMNSGGEPYGLEYVTDTDMVNDTIMVVDKEYALKHLQSYVDAATGIDADFTPAQSLMLKIKALPDKTPAGASPGVTQSAPLPKLPGGKVPADLIANIVTSAENKHGFISHEAIKVKAEIDAALNNPDPIMAHKHLAVAMTIAKLGGKQRTRYKQLLDMHLGVQTPEPQKAPAYAAGSDKADLLPSKPAGFASSELWGPGQGNAYVSPSNLSAPQAKRKIQEALTKRLLDIPVAEFAKVFSKSPGMSEGPKNEQLAKAALQGSVHPPAPEGTMLYRVSGSWVIGQTPYAETSMPATKANLELALRESVVNALIGTWASTSNDNNVRSLGLQNAAVEEFNLDKEWIFNWHSKPAEMDSHMAHHNLLYRRFLREMYNHTQADFAAKGVKYLQLRRGVHAAPTKKDVGTALYGTGATGSIMQRPLSSYSSNLATAKGFGGYVHEAWVPVERIIGSALTGFGCQSEYEFVVIGGHNVVKVVS